MRPRTHQFILLALLTLGAIPAAAQGVTLLDNTAPAFDLVSLTGERVALIDLRGKIVVLHFGTGW